MPAIRDIGVDVIAASGVGSLGLARRVGDGAEIEAFGVDGTLAAKEAATKVVGGRPPGASLRDIRLVSAPSLRDQPVIATLLRDLGIDQSRVLGWRFDVSPDVQALVAAAGGCCAGGGVVGRRRSGDLVAVCLGWQRDAEAVA